MNNTRTARKVLSPEQSFVVRLDAIRREFDYSRGGGRLQFDPAMREAMAAAERAAYAYRRANPFCEHCGAVGGEYDNHVNNPCSGLRAEWAREEEREAACDSMASARYEESAYGRD